MDLEELERGAGLNPDSADYRLRQQLAEADDELIERLVQMRKDKGLTQKVVAQRMKRDVAAVSNFERLRADPHLSTIRRYAAAIGASITHEVIDAEEAEVSQGGSEDSEFAASLEPASGGGAVLPKFVEVARGQDNEFLNAFLRVWRRTHIGQDRLEFSTTDQAREVMEAVLEAAREIHPRLCHLAEA